MDINSFNPISMMPENDGKEWNCRLRFPYLTYKKVKLLSIADDKTMKAVISDALDFYFDKKFNQQKQ